MLGIAPCLLLVLIGITVHGAVTGTLRSDLLAGLLVLGGIAASIVGLIVLSIGALMLDHDRDRQRI